VLFEDMMNDYNEKKKQGNFLEMVEILISYNEQVGVFVLGNTP
jgi:hypothetical protein